MSKDAEVRAALDAFNRVRAEVGGITTEDQQRYAMNEALDAADRVRRDVPKVECEYCDRFHDPRLACPEYVRSHAR